MDTFTPNFYQFPQISYDLFITSSPKNALYNCIAYAAGDTQRWWWPNGYYWPDGVSRTVELKSFIDAFATLGYKVCKRPDYKEGLEKIAIYTLSDGTPTHAARQISDEYWVSKIGRDNDIHHKTLDSIAGGIYGKPKIYMFRKK